MNATMKKALTICLALAALCLPAAGQNQASSDLLLPYFEVDAANPGGLTTLFAVGNSTDQPVEVLATVHTNWGIPILEVPFTLQAREIRTVNLRDWFREGGDPKKALAAAEVEHLAAAASGRPSPANDLYYSTEVRPDLQVGYVTLRTQGDRPDALWGDWFNVDVAGNLARGDVLVNIDRSTGCPGLCKRHLLRYLSGGGFDGGTEVIIWRENQGQPSANPEAGIRMQADATAFDEPGRPIENHQLDLLPVEKVLVSELGLQEPFGALDVATEEETFFAVQHTAESRYSVGLTAYCLPEIRQPGPHIEILKTTNGADANKAPGPSVAIGGPVTWEYLVTNNGGVHLSDIVVEDDKEGAVTCPHDSLAPGESMTCTKTGTAKACQYKNTATASGVSPSGAQGSDSDISHYIGDEGAAVFIASILVNGQNAATSPGPGFATDSNLDWTFKITNSGKIRLTGIQLTGGNATCPQSALDPGQSMDCTATGKALNGPHSLPVSVTGNGSCSAASDSGTGYYQGQNENCVAVPAIQIKKSTNGQDADSAPGPTIEAGSTVLWTYVVTNTGDITLNSVNVTDDKGVAVSCPKTTLAAGESMTCTGSGIAVIGQYQNVGTATGTAASPCSTLSVSDTDPSHYYGVKDPKITIVKKTNGQDANTAPGPEIEVGDPVLWEYVVTNTGEITLTGLAVTDDKGVAVTCPKTTLKPGESMTCTGTGKAQACQYQNLGTVTGTAYGGAKVSASDPSHYFGKFYPAIKIKKATNGQDADTAPGPQIPAGSQVNWTYVVTNTGDVPLTGVAVSDDKGVSVSCPKTSLAAGESMTCTGSGTAVEGQYRNVGSVTGQPPCGNPVSDDDPSHYFGTGAPELSIVKKTNGQDANTAPGPEVAVGSTVNWTYIVTNTGDVALSNLKVTDDKGVAVSCPKTTLAVGESMTCTGSGKAQACQYQNIGTVTGKAPNGQTLTASDPSHYYGKTYPAIEVEAKINGDHADTPKGPEFPVGATVPFTYWVKNTGDTTLTGIVVTDSKGVSVSCPKTSLNPGESMFCSGSGIAQAGQYSATATATGNGSCGQKVSDSDPVHYYGKSKVYDEGCSHGYWKNHTGSWPATGFSTSQKVSSVFSQASLYSSLANASLHASLSFSGGSDTTGAAGNLLKQATGSLLNAAHPGVDFPYSTSQVINEVNSALASKNSSTMLALASALDQANNLGCPLN